MFSPKPLIFLFAFLFFLVGITIALKVNEWFDTTSVMPGVIGYSVCVLAFIWMLRIYQRMWKLDWRFRNKKK